jgi:predicted 3-demethylubiquinone-9 3-methyltransferase (glyoxalase superfamily)
MPAIRQRITPFLWFDDQAEEAAAFYTSIFKNSKVTATTRYSKEAEQAAGRPAGSVMTVSFELDGQEFTALNGGPVFKFNEALSLVVHCQSQEEVDHYWNRLSEGGDPRAQQCGWLRDAGPRSGSFRTNCKLLTDPSGPAGDGGDADEEIDIATWRAAAGWFGRTISLSAALDSQVASVILPCCSHRRHAAAPGSRRQRRAGGWAFSRRSATARDDRRRPLRPEPRHRARQRRGTVTVRFALRRRRPCSRFRRRLSGRR